MPELHPAFRLNPKGQKPQRPKKAQKAQNAEAVWAFTSIDGFRAGLRLKEEKNGP